MGYTEILNELEEKKTAYEYMKRSGQLSPEEEKDLLEEIKTLEKELCKVDGRRAYFNRRPETGWNRE